MSHTGEKPYQCSQCDNDLTSKRHLEIHHMSHTGEKPYQCNQCDKAFTQAKHLEIHKKNSHWRERAYKYSQYLKYFKVR